MSSLNNLKNTNLNKSERINNFDQAIKNNFLNSNKLINLPSSSSTSLSKVLNAANSLSLLNDEDLTQQRRPSVNTYLHSSGSATPVFGQSSDTASTLSFTSRATTPVSFSNISEIKKMGGNLSTNFAENQFNRINNNRNEIIMNDQSCNLSHNHPIYRFLYVIK